MYIKSEVAFIYDAGKHGYQNTVEVHEKLKGGEGREEAIKNE